MILDGPGSRETHLAVKPFSPRSFVKCRPIKPEPPPVLIKAIIDNRGQNSIANKVNIIDTLNHNNSQDTEFNVANLIF